MKEKTEVNFSDVDQMSDPNHAVREMDAVRGLPGIQEMKGLALSVLKPAIGERVLDLGCGTGEDLRLLAGFVGEKSDLLGIDLSENMVIEARRRTPVNHPHIRFHSGDIQHLALEDGSREICWCERALQHVESPERVVREIRRVLVPGGRALFLDTDWETFVVHSRNGQLTRRLLDFFADSIQNGRIGRALPALCEAEGLKVKEIFSRTVFSRDSLLLFEGLDFLSFLRLSAEKGIATREEIDSWESEQQILSESSQFFFAVTIFGVLAEKAA